MVLKVNEVSFGIEVRGEDLTVALQAEELTLQQLGTVGLWQFLRGQCPGKDGGHSTTDRGTCLGQPQFNLYLSLGSKGSTLLVPSSLQQPLGEEKLH